MPELTRFVKDPQSSLDYVWDWSDWLGEDTIASHDVTAETGITVDSSTATTTAVTVWLAGGTNDVDYDVKVTIDTAAGRTDERTSKIRVRQK